MDVFAKQPYEQFSFEVDFAPRLAADDTLASIDAVATWTDSDEEVAGVVHAAAVNARVATVTVKAGESGCDYNLHIRCVSTNGAKVEHDVLMRVRERRGRLR